MQCIVRSFPQWGRSLWIRTQTTELVIPLGFGLRITHLSCPGMENLYYTQPEDLSDGFAKENGWRLYGGHRLWMAPESAHSYTPDNDPIRYQLQQNTLLLEQRTDPVTGIRKRMYLVFLPCGDIEVTHELENETLAPIRGAGWGIHTMDAGGKAEITFSCGTKGGYQPKRTVSLWSDTNLHDPRIRFDRDRIIAAHQPLPDYFKIGLSAATGEAVFQNKGQQLSIRFGAEPDNTYPDNGSNFELYMNSRFMELETLGCLTDMQPGQHVRHSELWQLRRL